MTNHEWMPFEVVYDRTYAGLPEEWVEFFTRWPDVARVEVMEPTEWARDVTVFYSDSIEPFPLSSLVADSPLREDLGRLVEWE